MKQIVLTFILLAIISCGNQSVDPQKAYMEELTADIVHDNLSRNGSRVICSEPTYRACYNIDAVTCTSEIETVNNGCIKFADTKIGGKAELTKKAGAYGEYWASCLFIKHAMMHSEKIQEISRCLQTVKFDKNESVKNLFAPETKPTDYCYNMQDCVIYIRTKVEKNWSKPTNPPRKPAALLQLQLDRDGNLLDLKLVESSGLKEHDDSILKAVRSAAPFSGIKGLPPIMYEQAFQVFKLNFQF